jgi:hypothetical protein
VHGVNECDAVLSEKQALYVMEVSLWLEAPGGMSDTVRERFGVREIESRIDPDLHGHTFYLNGQKVLSRQPHATVTRWLRTHVSAPATHIDKPPA